MQAPANACRLVERSRAAADNLSAPKVGIVNQEFARVFGYAVPESVGRNISELIAPGDMHADEDRHTELAVQGQRVDAEGLRIRKDGSRLDVAMIRVPVSIAPGKILVYAIYRDITESKKAQEALQRSYEQLHVLSHRIFKVQEEEKRHLARELHDVMGQALTAARISLQSARNAEDIAGVRRRLDDGLSILELLLQQAKQLSLDLRPPLLDDLGLVPALRWYLDQQAQRAGFRVEFFAPPSFERVGAEIETACFRVAQEAVTNVVRHARARTVAVKLDRTADELHLIVRDDGIGFDAPAALGRVERNGNLGLIGMRERVSLAGGELDIKSGPGGTEVHAFFPIDSSGHISGVAP